MSNLQCETLPESISRCWNLQALHVIDCRELLRLPESIGKLRKLRTLDLSGAWKLHSLPQSIGDCNNLHSLRLISCVNLIMQPLDLFRMPQNSWNINLSACSRITLLPNSVTQLEMLNSLNLSFCSDLQGLPGSFNWHKLCALKLSHTKLRKLPDGIVNLQRLKELDLKGCNELCGMPVGIGQLTQLRRLGLFVVGNGREYASMSELCSLNMLTGDLEIKSIRYIKGSDDDRTKAYLSEKNNLQEVTLKWHSRKHDIHMAQELDLLNKLQPPTGIKKLFIHGYPGQQFSCWMTKEDDSSSSLKVITKQFGPLPFLYLTHMELVNCPNLMDLSGLVKLPSLNTLKLDNLSAVESIGGGPFPLLKELHIQKMPCLSYCSTMIMTTLADREGDESNHQAIQCFPCMVALEIIKCPKLKVKPAFPSSLESLVLASSNMQLLHPPVTTCSASCSKGAMLSSSTPLLRELSLSAMVASSSRWDLLQQVTALQSLEISLCDDLVQLPQSMQKLTSLQHLKIWNCGSLRKVPEWIGQLCSLQKMDIRGCTSLSSLPQSMVQLNSLQYLVIGNCDALQLPEWLGDLCSLRSLDIWGLPRLTCLPPSLQHLASLQELKISCFDALLQLPEWLGELSALRRLKIETCPGLTSLPSSMKRLTDLQELEIICCPGLRRRYRKGEGEDWHLISHIPHVDIWRITDED
uniref:Uncharacterized protein n=1 Tax=Arundo donax TaxID=35708 RepID=A0A0A9D973_ARUDO